MKELASQSSLLDRRSFVRAATLCGSGLMLAGLGLIEPTSIARADDTSLPFAGMTIAQFEEAVDPEHYATLSDEVKEELAQYYMYETPSGEDQTLRIDTGGSVTCYNLSTGYHQVGFTFCYRPSVSCTSLFMRVTISNSSGFYDSREFNGSGSELWGPGTFYNVPSGSCTVVATAYAPMPPAQYSSSPRQCIRYVTV